VLEVGGVNKGRMASATITVNVKHGKNSHDFNLSLDDSLARLRDEIYKKTEIAPSQQKLMYKGQLKNEDDGKTLKELNFVNNTKLMLIGTKIQEVMQVTTAMEKAQNAPSVEEMKKAEEEKIVFDPNDKEHKKILDQGPPADAMAGILNRHDPIPPGGIKGVSDKVVSGKLRLTLKSETDELWIQSATSTRQVPFATVSDIKDFPVPGKPEYSVVVLLLGKTSKYYFYWVPSQYVRAFKRTILGFF
jgi:hypothetical protein